MTGSRAAPFDKQRQRELAAPSARDQSPGEIGDIVQRVAAGDALTPDVQATAEAGVAGSGHALPHGDRIQQSFGHHDVSRITAHVGGDAPATRRSER